MKDVAVVRDVTADAISAVSDIIKTYDDVKKVCDLKLRVAVPGFKRISLPSSVERKKA